MFMESYTFVSKEEGGYVHDKDDSGGATKGGVTQGTYDGYRVAWKLPQRPVRYITKLEHERIFSNIWNDCRANQLPEGLNLVHYDFAINAGNSRAAKTLQTVLEVIPDGSIGPKTLAALGGKDVEKLIDEYSARRRVFYESLAERRPKDKKFLKGWLLRTDRCSKRAKEIYRGSDRSKRSCGV